MNATVSVIIPAFNSAQTIGRAVSSVMSQTYTDIEIIVINDGSTDKTKEICQEFENQDSRIKIINQSQLGPGPARNAGLDVAKGEYVYFMDSDDEIDNNLISICVEKAERESLDLLVFGFSIVDESSKEVERIVFHDSLAANRNALADLYVATFLRAKHGNGFLWNKFYRQTIIKNNSIRFGDYNIMEDELFNIEYFKRVERCSIISKVLYRYYWSNPSSIRRRFNPSYLEALKKVHVSFMEFKEDFQVMDRSFESIVNSRTWNGLFGYLSDKLINSDPKLSRGQIKEQFFKLASDSVFRYVGRYQYENKVMRCIEKPFYYSIEKNDSRLFLIASSVYNALMPLRKVKRFFNH